MMGYDTILSVDEATRGVMDSINKELCETIDHSLEENLRNVLKPVKMDIEELAEKIQQDLQDTGNKIEQTAIDSREQVVVLQKELIESQMKTTAKADEVLTMIEKGDKLTQQRFDDQTVLFEELTEKIQQDLQDTGNKIEQTAIGAREQLGVLQKELLESQMKTTAKVDEVLTMIEKGDKLIQQRFDDQTVLFEELRKKIQQDLQDTGNKIEQTAIGAREQLGVLQKELLESQMKTTAKADEVLTMIEKGDKLIQQGIDCQTVLLEKVAQLQEDILYLKQPFFKKIFNKRNKKDEKT